MGHRRRPDLARREGLGHLAELGLHEEAQFGGNLAQGGRDPAKDSGVGVKSVPRCLPGDVWNGQVKPSQSCLLDLSAPAGEGRIGAHGTVDVAGEGFGSGRIQPLEMPGELVKPYRCFEAERCGQGMDEVGSPGHDGIAVGHGKRFERRRHRQGSRADDLVGLRQLQDESGIDDVLRGHSVVDPFTRLARALLESHDRGIERVHGGCAEGGQFAQVVLLLGGTSDGFGGVGGNDPQVSLSQRKCCLDTQMLT